MNTCVIFCAGDFDTLAEPLTEVDLVIAADGGLRHLQGLGRRPDLVLGDFDSLGYTPMGAEVHPVEKDDTDSMLALRRGLAAGFRRFVLYGALDGPRLDHTLANLQSLMFLAEQGCRGYLVGKEYIATAISGGTFSFPASCTGIVSVFALGGPARDVTITGLKYTLDRGILTADFPLGVSNQLTGQPAAVSVGTGCLLLLYDRVNGIWDREKRKIL